MLSTNIYDTLVKSAEEMIHPSKCVFVSVHKALRNLAKFIMFLCRDRQSYRHRQTLGTDNKYTKTIETDR